MLEQIAICQRQINFRNKTSLTVCANSHLQTRAMEARQNALLRYLEGLGLRLRRVPSVLRSLVSVTTEFQWNGVPFPTTCTHNLGGQQVCRVLRDLPVWNELLSFLKAELREVSPGKLVVSRLQNPYAFGWMHEERLLEHAAALFQRLLANHRCVVAVDVDCSAFDRHYKHFCDALRLSTSLKTLRLVGKSEPQFIVGGKEPQCSEICDLIVAVCEACQLEELECNEMSLLESGSTVQARFAEFVRKSTTLKTLSVTDLTWRTDHKVNMEPLLENSSVTKLTIDGACLATGCGASFFSYLARNSVLTELTVVKQSRHSPCNVEPLFKGLEKNSVLRKLTLRRFVFDLADASLVSGALIANTSLREVDFSSCEWSFMNPWLSPGSLKQLAVQDAQAVWGEWWRVQLFVDALRGSTSLQKLVFGQNYFQDHELRRLLAAVKESETLCELRFDQLNHDSFWEFCEVLRETDTVGKVTVRQCYSNAACFADSLKRCELLPAVTSHSFRFLNTAYLQEICSALALHDSITAIHLRIDPLQHVIDEQCASSIATYLSSTTTLKEIYIDISATNASLNQVIVTGLSKNRSLERLGMYSCSLHDSDMHAFSDWLQQSRTLYCLSCSFVCPTMSCFLMNNLAERLRSSYTLTSLDIERYLGFWQGVKNLLIRNALLTERAAHFALGSTLKECAAAFELVSWHPLVLDRVCQLAAVSTEEAKRMVVKSKRRLSKDFWQLAGVVKEELRCHERGDGKVQIDQLGTDAWLAIHRFLSVTDVVDSPST
ncbi:hypothetical protein V5799_000380 [Amblyomma americanum]|uniref:Nlr family card domain protein n=1 Tax=Amblyomma americanum TaxID=6943 RepID=A0AAQ4D379_AMBAM